MWTVLKVNKMIYTIIWKTKNLSMEIYYCLFAHAMFGWVGLEIVIKGLDFHPHNRGKFYQWHRVLSLLCISTFRPWGTPSMFDKLKVTEILNAFMIWKPNFFVTILLNKTRRNNVQEIHSLCQNDNVWSWNTD